RCRHGEVRGGDEPEGESEDDGAARKAWRARASAGSGADQRLWSSSGAGGGEPVSSDPAILGGCHRGCLKARRVTAVSDALPPTPDPALVSALAADLDAVDFRSEPLRRLWGEEADDALGRGVREPLLRAVAGD